MNDAEHQSPPAFAPCSLQDVAFHEAPAGTHDEMREPDALASREQSVRAPDRIVGDFPQLVLKGAIRVVINTASEISD